MTLERTGKNKNLLFGLLFGNILPRVPSTPLNSQMLLVFSASWVLNRNQPPASCPILSSLNVFIPRIKIMETLTMWGCFLSIKWISIKFGIQEMEIDSTISSTLPMGWSDSAEPVDSSLPSRSQGFRFSGLTKFPDFSSIFAIFLMFWFFLTENLIHFSK